MYRDSPVHSWFYMGAFRRIVAGQTGFSEVYPLALINGTNHSLSDPTNYAGGSPFDGYQAKFLSLWGES